MQELISYSGTLRSIFGLTKIPRDKVPPFLARFENAVEGVPGSSVLLSVSYEWPVVFEGDVRRANYCFGLAVNYFLGEELMIKWKKIIIFQNNNYSAQLFKSVFVTFLAYSPNYFSVFILWELLCRLEGFSIEMVILLSQV